jgi:hypothetical protein
MIAWKDSRLTYEQLFKLFKTHATHQFTDAIKGPRYSYHITPAQLTHCFIKLPECNSNMEVQVGGDGMHKQLSYTPRPTYTFIPSHPSRIHRIHRSTDKRFPQLNMQSFDEVIGSGFMPEELFAFSISVANANILFEVRRTQNSKRKAGNLQHDAHCDTSNITPTSQSSHISLAEQALCDPNKPSDLTDIKQLQILHQGDPFFLPKYPYEDVSEQHRLSSSDTIIVSFEIITATHVSNRIITRAVYDLLQPQEVVRQIESAFEVSLIMIFVHLYGINFSE